MKKLLIGLLLFVLLLVLVAGGLLGLAVYNANRIIQEYRPEIEKMAGDAVGSDVKLGDIGLALYPPLGIRISNVTLTDRKNPEETLSVKEVNLRMDPWPLLQSKVEITSLTLEAPQLTAIMEKSGTRIAALQPAPDSETASTETAASSSSALPFDINIDTIRIRDGVLKVSDRIYGTEYTVEPFNITTGIAISPDGVRLTRLAGDLQYLTDIGVDGAGQGYEWESGLMDAGDLTTRFLGNEVKISGALKTDDPTKSVNISSPRIDLKSLTPLYDAFAPYVMDYGLEGDLQPDMKFSFTPGGGYAAEGTVKLAGVGASAYGIPVKSISGPVSVKVDANGQQASGEGITGTLNGIPLTASFSSSYAGDTAKVEKAKIEAFSGKVENSTTVKMTDAMPFDTSVKLAGLSLQELAAAFAPDMPVTIEGNLKSANLDLAGTMDDALYPSLKGKGDVEITDSLLGKVNIAAAILSKVRDLPFIQESLASLAPADFRDALSRDYTVLNLVKGSYSIGGQQIHTDDLQIAGELFSLDIRGDAGFDMNLDLDAIIHFSPALSRGLVSAAQPLNAALDGQGRLSFPLKVKGSAWSPSVLPDLKGLLKGKVQEVKQEVKETAKETANEMVNNLLKGDTDTKGTEKKLKSKGKDLIKSLGF